MSKQIFTTTVNNAANMLRTIQVLNDEINDDSSEEYEDMIYASNSIQVLLHSKEEDTSFSDIGMTEFLKESDFTITAIKCVVHTLQLATTEFLKNAEV